MTPAQEERLIRYLMRIAIAAETISKELKKKDTINHELDSEINHVSYTEEQCGYEK